MGFFHLPKKLANRKNVTLINRIANQYCKKQAQKLSCSASFCHYCLANMIMHLHMCCYPFFENGMKTGKQVKSLYTTYVLILVC